MVEIELETFILRIVTSWVRKRHLVRQNVVALPTLRPVHSTIYAPYFEGQKITEDTFFPEDPRPDTIMWKEEVLLFVSAFLSIQKVMEESRKAVAIEEFVVICLCTSGTNLTFRKTRHRSFISFSGQRRKLCSCAISIASKDSTNQRTRHIRKWYHFIREKIADGTIIVSYTPGDVNPNDIFIKVLDRETTYRMLDLLNLS